MRKSYPVGVSVNVRQRTGRIICIRVRFAYIDIVHDAHLQEQN